MEKVHTRANNDSIREFSTLREAIDFANKQNASVIQKMVADKTPTDAELRQVVWKISFVLPSNEKFELVLNPNGEWVLREWGDEVAKILAERADAVKFHPTKPL